MKQDTRYSLVLTCEHAVNTVPARYRSLFRGREELLSSHRGYDPGALELAKTIRERTGAPLFAAKATRLLIEVNRSLHHRNLFSTVTACLPDDEKQRIVNNYYLAHREPVEDEIRRRIHRGERVLHVGVHTCTPVLDGEVRTLDIGLLYDPARIEEKSFCRRWKDALRERDLSLRVRFNSPYRGNADGFTTALRKEFDGCVYLGIEMEVNQTYVLERRNFWKPLREAIAESLERQLNIKN